MQQFLNNININMEKTSFIKYSSDKEILGSPKSHNLFGKHPKDKKQRQTEDLFYVSNKLKFSTHFINPEKDTNNNSCAYLAPNDMIHKYKSQMKTNFQENHGANNTINLHKNQINANHQKGSLKTVELSIVYDINFTVPSFKILQQSPEHKKKLKLKETKSFDKINQTQASQIFCQPFKPTTFIPKKNCSSSTMFNIEKDTSKTNNLLKYCHQSISPKKSYQHQFRQQNSKINIKECHQNAQVSVCKQISVSDKKYKNLVKLQHPSTQHSSIKNSGYHQQYKRSYTNLVLSSNLRDRCNLKKSHYQTDNISSTVKLNDKKMSLIINKTSKCQNKGLQNKQKVPANSISTVKSNNLLMHSCSLGTSSQTNKAQFSRVKHIFQNKKYSPSKLVNFQSSKQLMKSTTFGEDIVSKPILVQRVLISQPKTINHQQLIPTKISIDNFQIVQKIGKGAFGNVFLARQKLTKFMCVLKCLSKNKIKQEKLEEHVMRQIKFQSFLNHRHLMSLFGFFDDADKIYLIMEYMPDGSLSDNKKKRTQREISDLMRQVCLALACMHQQKILHRDIKPQNLFMNQNYLKIGDFGCSVLNDSMRNTLVGCLAYSSPEQFLQKAYDGKIDVWSIGILGYELLFDKSPFDSYLKNMNNEQQFPQILFPNTPARSPQAIDFLISLLKKDPNDRPSIKQILKHQFLTNKNA